MKTEGQGPVAPSVDTPLGAGLRFLTELIAWLSAAMAAPGWWVLPTLVVLVSVPAVFSTPGDKRWIGVKTPGPVRVLIEVALVGVALIVPWWVFSTSVCVVTTALVLGAVVAGWPRATWLWRSGRVA